MILPKLAKKNPQTRIIQHSHGIDMEEKGIKRLAFLTIEKLFEKKYETYIDIPLACSQASADYFYHDKELRGKCVILGNGIFTDKFKYNQRSRTELRSQMGIRDDDILIGAVGRLTKVKNYPFLIRLISNLPPHFKGVIVGGGEDRAMLSEMILHENLFDRFFLVGNKNNVADYYSAMDIFAMPSFNEGLPFSIIEAQTSGLPCIASTGISEECDLTGNVIFLNIDKQEDWLNFCVDYIPYKYNRDIFCEVVKEKGFSIEETFQIFMMLIGMYR
jgi:glycosyltransferase involved in cell wall biosynthesis